MAAENKLLLIPIPSKPRIALVSFPLFSPPSLPRPRVPVLFSRFLVFSFSPFPFAPFLIHRFFQLRGSDFELLFAVANDFRCELESARPSGRKRVGRERTPDTKTFICCRVAYATCAKKEPSGEGRRKKKTRKRWDIVYASSSIAFRGHEDGAP